jgi:hypothetical protein
VQVCFPGAQHVDGCDGERFCQRSHCATVLQNVLCLAAEGGVVVLGEPAIRDPMLRYPSSVNCIPGRV